MVIHHSTVTAEVLGLTETCSSDKLLSCSRLSKILVSNYAEGNYGPWCTASSHVAELWSLDSTVPICTILLSEYLGDWAVPIAWDRARYPEKLQAGF